MKYVCSLITVKDIQKSRYLYETILKQKVKSDYGENVAFYGDFAIHQAEHFKGLIDGKKITEKSNSFELYFEDDDIESLEKIIAENHLETVHIMREQPWRQKVLRFYDYDGNIIEVGETLEHVAYTLYLENKTVAEISRITYLGADAIEEAINKYSQLDRLLDYPVEGQ